MKNRTKYISNNGVFYIDHDNQGMVCVDEQSIINLDGLSEDIKEALNEYRSNKKLVANRMSSIKKILND